LGIVSGDGVNYMIWSVFELPYNLSLP
jgi:hypothetical protein